MVNERVSFRYAVPEANTGETDDKGFIERVVPLKERCGAEIFGAVLNDADATAMFDPTTEKVAGNVAGSPVIV